MLLASHLPWLSLKRDSPFDLQSLCVGPECYIIGLKINAV